MGPYQTGNTVSGALDSSLLDKTALPPMASRPRGLLMRMFGSAVIGQALLSAASLGVGLLLIRHSTDAQYGAYVLVINAVLLLTSLQSAFFGPAMVIRMTPLDREGRGAVVGGLYTEQRRLLRWVATGGVLLVGVLALSGAISPHAALIVGLGIAVAAAAMRREFFRIALQAHQRASQVLRGDLLYVLLLAGGAGMAVLTTVPVMLALLTMSIAAVAAGTQLSRELRDSEAWHPAGIPGLLRQIAPGAAWAMAGAATHWLFSQGYSYIVAMTLDVAAVAAIATTRLLLMPVNLVSTGISSLMLPLTAGWLRDSSARSVLARLMQFCGLMIAGAGLYLVLMWSMRDWVFVHVLRKQFADRDSLLILWSLIVLLMLLRDQLLYLPLARGRFRELTLVSLAAAALSMAVTYWGMVGHGVTGALFGVIAGELASVCGCGLLALRELRVTLPSVRA